jgi:coenzyme F420-reducing hydrogenase beta subunit
VKALRLLCEADDELKKKFAVLIGIVCGHLKSSRYADMFSWQLGIAPGKLRGIDFRVKTPGFQASSYSIEAKGLIDGEMALVRAPAHVLFGYDWGEGFFKYKACDFCDDVFAETADVTFGDAWLEGYDDDWRGANVVVVRNRRVGEILERGIASGALAMQPISSELCVQSQAAGLRHRRGGLSYRLEQVDRAGGWRPAKRVRASGEDLTRQERKKYALRREMADLSHDAFQSAVAGEDFRIFTKAMGPMIARYRKSLLPTFEERALRMMRRVIGKWKVKLGIGSGGAGGRK